MTRIVLIDAAQCEQLPQLQTQGINGTPHGRGQALLITAATWQAFYATQMPPVVEPWWAHRHHTQEHFYGVLWVDPSLPFFNGHFPGNPILPGVAQVNWAIETTQSIFPAASAARFCGMSNIKFKAPVQPNTWLALDLKRVGSDVTFEFSDGTNIRTQGRLQYHD